MSKTLSLLCGVAGLCVAAGAAAEPGDPGSAAAPRDALPFALPDAPTPGAALGPGGVLQPPEAGHRGIIIVPPEVGDRAIVREVPNDGPVPLAGEPR